MNWSGFMTTGDSMYRLLYSSLMPALWIWIASGPTWAAVLSVNCRTSNPLHVVAPAGSGQQAIRATPVVWLPISSHCAHCLLSILSWAIGLNSAPPPLLWAGRWFQGPPFGGWNWIALSASRIGLVVPQISTVGAWLPATCLTLKIHRKVPA